MHLIHSVSIVVLQADLSTPPSRRTVPRIPPPRRGMRFFPRTLKFIPHAPLTRYRAADAAAPARIDQARHEPYYPATAAAAQAAVRHSIFIYTEEQRGNQLVESTVIGMLSDISGSDKLIVVQDPFSGLKFIYRVDHESSNLDAAALTEQDGSAFNGKQSVEINAMTYKLGTADNAMKLLRGKTHWIQDKGSVLSVLLQNAASRKTRFAPQRIERDRMRKIPPGVPIERLPG